MCSCASAAFVSFETATRYTLDLIAVPILKAKTHLPVVVDPTHGIGLRDFVPANVTRRYRRRGRRGHD